MISLSCITIFTLFNTYLIIVLLSINIINNNNKMLLFIIKYVI